MLHILTICTEIVDIIRLVVELEWLATQRQSKTYPLWAEFIWNQHDSLNRGIQKEAPVFLWPGWPVWRGRMEAKERHEIVHLK